MLESAKRAMAAVTGYEVRLSRMVGDVSTYTAKVAGEKPREFEWYEDAAIYAQDRMETLRVEAAFAVFAAAMIAPPAPFEVNVKMAHDTVEIEQLRNSLVEVLALVKLEYGSHYEDANAAFARADAVLAKENKP